MTDHIAEARRLLDWGDEYLRVTDVALAVRHLVDAIEELRPVPPTPFHAWNAANCRDAQGHPPVAGVVCETCAAQPEYSRCPRCGVEHTDRPGKLCYHCGLEPAGEPETVPVLLSQHRDRVWRGAIPTGDVPQWLMWMEGRWWCSNIWPATRWELLDLPVPPEVRFGPFTAVEEA